MLLEWEIVCGVWENTTQNVCSTFFDTYQGSSGHLLKLCAYELWTRTKTLSSKSHDQGAKAKKQATQSDLIYDLHDEGWCSPTMVRATPHVHHHRKKRVCSIHSRAVLAAICDLQFHREHHTVHELAHSAGVSGSGTATV